MRQASRCCPTQIETEQQRRLRVWADIFDNGRKTGISENDESPRTAQGHFPQKARLVVTQRRTGMLSGWDSAVHCQHGVSLEAQRKLDVAAVLLQSAKAYGFLQ